MPKITSIEPRESRIKQEAGNLLGSLLAGTAWRPFIRRGFDALLIGIFLYFVDSSAARVLPLPPCHFLAQGRCAILEPAVLIRLVIFLPALFLGGYLSTSFCRQERFSHSASVSAFVLLGLLCALVWGHFSLWYFIAAIPAVTLTTFYAYRLALR